MCPFCFATLALVAAGATSAGGLATLAVNFSGRGKQTEVTSNSSERSNPDANERNPQTKGSVAK